MNTEYSKQFAKTAKLLSGKYLKSLKSFVLSVKEAKDISEIKNCRKILGAENTYRIRMGGYRIVFVVIIIGDTVFFLTSTLEKCHFLKHLTHSRI